MNRYKTWMAALALLPATSLMAADQALSIVPGEWAIELKQKGGATYRDRSAEEGFSGVNDERVLQNSTLCLGPDKAKLQPEMFAPNCTISNPRHTTRSFEAELSCPHPAMQMGGSLTITTYDDGKKVIGTQVMTGGGEKLGAVIINTLTMTRTGDCKD